MQSSPRLFIEVGDGWVSDTPATVDPADQIRVRLALLLTYARPCSSPGLRAGRVSGLAPEAATAVEPDVDLLQGSGVGRIETTSALSPDDGEATLPEHAQVLRHPGLRDAELALDGRGEDTGGLLTVCQQLEDPTTHWISEDLECVHPDIVSAETYISQD